MSTRKSSYQHQPDSQIFIAGNTWILNCICPLFCGWICCFDEKWHAHAIKAWSAYQTVGQSSIFPCVDRNSDPQQQWLMRRSPPPILSPLGHRCLLSSCTLKYLGRSYYCYLDQVLVQETNTEEKKSLNKWLWCCVYRCHLCCEFFAVYSSMCLMWDCTYVCELKCVH